MWYGGSTIAAKFINYLLTPLISYSVHVSKDANGEMSTLYALIPVFNIIFTYGFETAYFRFSSGKENNRNIAYHGVSAINAILC